MFISVRWASSHHLFGTEMTNKPDRAQDEADEIWLLQFPFPTATLF